MEFNLSEVLDLAIHIEETGNTFYKSAAKHLPEHRDFFEYLANEELGHNSVFSSLKEKSISEEFKDSYWNPDNIISSYFDSISGSTIFKKENELEELFKEATSFIKVIDWAISREHDTILFFEGLKATFNNKKDKEVVDEIITEELKHVHILMSKKSDLIQ